VRGAEDKILSTTPRLSDNTIFQGRRKELKNSTQSLYFLQLLPQNLRIFHQVPLFACFPEATLLEYDGKDHYPDIIS